MLSGINDTDDSVVVSSSAAVGVIKHVRPRVEPTDALSDAEAGPLDSDAEYAELLPEVSYCVQRM